MEKNREFDIDPGLIFKKEFEKRKRYEKEELEFLHKIFIYIEEYQWINKINVKPYDDFKYEEYDAEMNKSRNDVSKRESKNKFPYVGCFYNDKGKHSYFHGFSHILEREENKDIFDILFFLKLNNIEFHKINDFLDYHETRIENYNIYLDLLCDQFEEYFEIKVLKRVKKFIKNNPIQREIPVKVNTKNISIDGRIIETLFSRLQVYFNESDYDDLKIVLSGKHITRKLLFNSMSSVFIEVFKTLKREGFISSQKKDISIWIVKHFKYNNDNKIAKDFNDETVKNGFKPSTPKARINIINKEILTKLKEITNPK